MLRFGKECVSMSETGGGVTLTQWNENGLGRLVARLSRIVAVASNRQMPRLHAARESKHELRASTQVTRHCML